MATPNPITIEGARLLFKNFEGREDQYNTKGDRNFAVVIPPEMAEVLAKDEWNVKILEARDEGDSPTAYLPVKVSFKVFPPKIVMISSANRMFLNEGNVELLDWAQFKNVDLVVRPYEWKVGPKTGIKAYLKTMYVTLEEDDIERKYANMEREG